MTASSASFSLSQYNAPTGSGGRDFDTGSKFKKKLYSGANRSFFSSKALMVGNEAAFLTSSVCPSSPAAKRRNSYAASTFLAPCRIARDHPPDQVDCRPFGAGI